MKKNKGILFFIAALTLCLFGLIGCTTPVTGPTTTPTTLYLVGDSTVCGFNDPYYYPRYGYGTQIGNYLNSTVTINNLALSGRSSKDFITYPNYATLTSSIKAGDYLIIGFGHNDEKAGDDTLYTDPTISSATSYLADTTSFQYYLYTYYVKVAQDKGATPILTTPIVRRSSSNNYTGTNIHVTTTSVVGGKTYNGGDYSQCIVDLGSKVGVTVIDNTTLTKTLHQTTFAATAAAGTANFQAWLFLIPQAVDDTHTNIYGASYYSYMMANALLSTSCSLKDYVLPGITVPNISILIPDASHTYPPKANPPTTKSVMWTTTNPWWGSVFGDVSSINTTNFNISEPSAGVVSVRSGSSTISNGKIASTSDGVAFYFQPLPAATNFTFTATATVQYVNVGNSQVAFGLMVKDAVWIDTADSTLISNYVACGPYKLTSSSWWTSFVRELTATTMQYGTTTVVTTSKPAVGNKIHLSIVKAGNNYTVTYGPTYASDGVTVLFAAEAPVTYTVDLGYIDSTNVYPGLFTARAVQIDFSDIVLTIN